jgi:pimeloyl-ACP methyl ester carboxylesterase
MPEYADTLARSIHVLGLERPHVVGNSFGATLALELADRHPAIAKSLVPADGYAGCASIPSRRAEPPAPSRSKLRQTTTRT